jgi:hypothetical protein
MMDNSMFSIACSVLIALIVVGNNIAGAIAGWEYGHATFYGDISGRGTEGKCECISKFS